MILYQGRGLTFFFDEWTWILERRNPSVDAFLQPHVGHMSALPVAFYELFLHVFGLTHYVAFRSLVLVLHLGCIALVFVFVRRRLPASVALVPVVALLLLGSAWQDLLWPFQIGFVLSVLGGVGALLLVESDTPRADRGAMACVVVALASSSVGLPIVGGLALQLVLERQWHRIRIVAIPLFLYVVWYVFYGESVVTAQGVVPFGRFGIEAAGAAVGALTGAGDVGGQWLLLVLGPFVAVSIIRAAPERRTRLIALAAIPAAYWTSLALGRSGFQPADASRYLYPGAVFVVLLLAECLRGVRIGPVVLGMVVLAGAWSVVWNVQEFETGRELMLPFTRDGRVEMGAMEVGIHGVESAYTAVRPPVRKGVADYVAAFDDLGFPAARVPEIRRDGPELRRKADAYLIAVAGIALDQPSSPSGPAPVVTLRGPAIADGVSCIVLTAGSAPVDVEVAPRTSMLRIDALGTSAVDLRLRNFGDTYSTFDAPLVTVAPGTARDLPVPKVTAGPWRVGVRTATSARVCGARLPSR